MAQTLISLVQPERPNHIGCLCGRLFVGASLRRFFGSAEDGVQKPFRKPWFGTFNMLFAGALGGRARRPGLHSVNKKWRRTRDSGLDEACLAILQACGWRIMDAR